MNSEPDHGGGTEQAQSPDGDEPVETCPFCTARKDEDYHQLPVHISKAHTQNELP